MRVWCLKLLECVAEGKELPFLLVDAQFRAPSIASKSSAVMVATLELGVKIALIVVRIVCEIGLLKTVAFLMVPLGRFNLKII